MKRYTVFILLFSMLIFVGCDRKSNTDSKTLDEIYRENGIPVKVETILPQSFVKELQYSATLTAERQAYAAAMMGGRIEKIHCSVGDYVGKDQTIMEFPEDAPQGKYYQAKTNFELAQRTVKRMRNLYKAGGISQQDLDQAEAQFSVAEANFDAVQQMLKVRAPISGNITSIAVRETDGVDVEDILATIANTQKMKAKVWVTEDEICTIKKGMRATATWKNMKLHGRVVEVAIAMDPRHNAFAVDMVFDNEKQLCKSGIIANISIQIYNNPTAILVPRTIVQKDRQGIFVYIAQKSIAKKCYISIGQENGNFEITEGLTRGEKLIVEGFNLVSDGTRITIIP